MEELLGVRFMQWQQIMLIAAPFVLLLGYTIWLYHLVKGRSLASTLFRLTTVAAAFTVIWVAVAYVLFMVAWMGTSDVTVEYDMRVATYNATVGWPFSVFREVLGQFHLPDWLQVIPLFVGLLLLAGAIAIARRLLAGSRFAVERHNKQYLWALAAISTGFLVVSLWPQAGRNPDMPTIAIPNGAVGVTYAYTIDEHHWPTTSFVLDSGSVRDMLDYYQSSLQAAGWKTVSSEDDQTSGFHQGKAVFSRDNQELELNITYGYQLSVTITKQDSPHADLEEVAVLPRNATLFYSHAIALC